MVLQKAEARNEADGTTQLWDKVQQANHSPQQETKHMTVTNHSKSPKVETAVLANLG